MKNIISEKYRKYLLKITYNKTTLFIIWGTDLTTSEEVDFITLDNSNKIICFEKKSKIYNFFKNSTFEIPDKVNFEEWLRKYSFRKEYSCYCLDLLTHESFKSVEKISLINNINLISDYIYQTSNNSMLKIRNKRVIKKVWDKIYNSFFWNIDNNFFLEESEIQDFIFSYNELINAFRNKLNIIV